ncbi:adenylosuccinate lyase [Thorsellia anophelis]|uniref:Adenylosuccinate lyase n=1 Tax=Thorsellia anophelis DSM 18579 TaxID=1123402 RepID=A0A1I0E1H1_9GAMM|nr:adenylosuccinate lyase [Thorsellia anophelis]SET38168.1 adenylosuccinate lyase [Thorsellia anophelis DSM 18579]
MASHVIDFSLLGNNFSTPEMRTIWSETNRLKKQAKVEVALAVAQGELGVIPKEAADAIAFAIDVDTLDLEAMAKDGALMKHSLMATIKALQAQCGQAGEFIHYGVTTQDIVDTATVLQLKEAFNVIEQDVNSLIKELTVLSEKHKHTFMVGRTHGMQALPTTFGFKVAIWLDEFLRHAERLANIKQRVLVGNVSGAICTYASLGEIGPEVENRTLTLLELGTPNIGWQSARDRLSEFGSICALISGTLGKIGNEFYNLMRTEINEIEEPFSEGKVGSTTMPHKRNPALLEGLASLTQPILSSVGLLFQSMHVEHERDAMSWRAEWIALPEICLYLSAQLKGAIHIIQGIKVNKERMLLNLQSQGGLLLSEKVMFEIGLKLGKQTAHQLVYEAAMLAFETDRPFKDILMAHPKLKAILNQDELDLWLKPESYVGAAILKNEYILKISKTYLESKTSNVTTY